MVKEPLSYSDATRTIRQIARTGDVSVSGHAWTEMGKDDLTLADVLRVLKSGSCDGCEFSLGTWRYRMVANKVVVPVAIASETQLRVVTAWRIRR